MTSRVRLAIFTAALVLLAWALTAPEAEPPRDEDAKIIKFRNIA